MLVQNVIRGVGGLSRGPGPDEVETIMKLDGLTCAALRTGHVASTVEAESLLGADPLDAHRHRHELYGPRSPYVSMTAGTYQDRGGHNRAAFAFDTALAFATDGFRDPGWVFYGYVFLLGRAAGSHAEFGEEVRDVHQHPAWSRFRSEGEVAVPVRVPPRRLRRAELYLPDDVLDAARAGRWPPEPADLVDNEQDEVFRPPEEIVTARGVV